MTVERDDASFSVVRRGYDRIQVDERMNRLIAELEAAAAGRNAAVEDLRTLTRQRDTSRKEAQAARTAVEEARGELDRLRSQVAELSVIPHTVDGMSERLQQMVRIAQDEVNDMRTRATVSAAQVLTLAQAEADELRERSLAERHEFEDERRAAEESLRAQLDETQSRLDKLRKDSDGQMARLDAELADRRTRAEQSLVAEVDERRNAMQNELAALEAAHHAESARIVDAARQDARARMSEATGEAQRVRAEARADVGAAQRELEELRVLQHQISEQLTSVRALLDWTLPQIAGNAGREGNLRTPPGPPSSRPATPAPRSPVDSVAVSVAVDSAAGAKPPNEGQVSDDAAAGPERSKQPSSGAENGRAEKGASQNGRAENGRGEIRADTRPSPAARHSRMAAPSAHP